MTESPIPFSAEMVRAILEDSKTQTRRVIKPQPTGATSWLPHIEASGFYPDKISANPPHLRCPYGAPGDTLWVREAWRAPSQYDDLPPSRIPPGVDVQYIADARTPWISRYRSSRFMPRWASRITLRITDVRVEKLQDITEEDAQAEGWPGPVTETGSPIASPLAWFANVWTNINGPGAWDDNPWVWALSFERVKP